MASPNPFVAVQNSDEYGADPVEYVHELKHVDAPVDPDDVVGTPSGYYAGCITLDDHLARWWESTSWDEVLPPAGWTRNRTDECGCQTWTRPHAPGESVTPKSLTAHGVGCARGRTDDRHPAGHVWSDHVDGALADMVTVQGRTLSAFAIYTALHHDGDYAEACRAVGIPTGYAPDLTAQGFSGDDLAPDRTERAERTDGRRPGEGDYDYRKRLERERRQMRRELDAEDRAKLVSVQGDIPALTGALLLDVDDSDPEYVVEQLWPDGGQVLLWAPAKVGKSTLAHNVFTSLLTGTALFGRYGVTRPTGKVGLIDTELVDNYLKRELRDEHPGFAENSDRAVVYFARGRESLFNAVDETSRAAWAKRLKADGVEVLIVDCLGPLIRSAGLDENSDGALYLNAIRALCEQAGVKAHFVVDHASSKPNAEDRGPRGDSGKVDAPDALWDLRQTGIGEGDARLFHLKVDGRLREHHLDLARPDNGYQFHKVIVGDDPYDDVQRQAVEVWPTVQDVLQQPTPPPSQSALKKAVRRHMPSAPAHEQLGKCFRALVGMGCLDEMPGERGALRYTLTGKRPPEVMGRVVRVDDGSMGGKSPEWVETDGPIHAPLPGAR